MGNRHPLEQGSIQHCGLLAIAIATKKQRGGQRLRCASKLQADELVRRNVRFIRALRAPRPWLDPRSGRRLEFVTGAEGEQILRSD